MSHFPAEAFVQTLAVAARTGRPGVARAFCEGFRVEVLELVRMLHAVGVLAPVTIEHPDPPGACEFCGADLAREGWFVDGAVRGGEFAVMCPECFADRGSALGWGRGQLWCAVGERGAPRAWMLVAGYDPRAPWE